MNRQRTRAELFYLSILNMESTQPYTSLRVALTIIYPNCDSRRRKRILFFRLYSILDQQT